MSGTRGLTVSLFYDTVPTSCVGSGQIQRAAPPPPPVPPRRASKPLISVTVQSSTESAQDTYLDGAERHSDANSQSGRSDSSSSDSLCCVLALGSLAQGVGPPAPLQAPLPVPAPAPPAPAAAPAPAPVPAPRDPPPAPGPAPSTLPPQPQQNDTLSLGPSAPEQPPHSETAAPKRKLSSIGIQVDCVLPIQREREDPLTPLKFQSIGVQVENGRPLSRASSMASRQNTESEAPDSAPPPSDSAPPPSDSAPPPSENNNNNTASNCNSGEPADHPAPSVVANANGDPRSAVARQPPKRAPVPARAASTSSTSSSPPPPPAESLDPALDPSSLPPPDPSLASCTTGGGQGDSASSGAGGPAPCLRDGAWFLKLLQAETARMEGWCQQMDQETRDHQISEEVLGTVRSAVGSAQLIMAQKFKQFRGLCNENLDLKAHPRPTAQDLAGFWDLLQLTIEDISMKFDELYQLKANNWQLPDKPQKKEEKKPVSSVPKKPLAPRGGLGKERSVDSALDKHRQEARKRLLAAKRAASARQNSATESADSIEIYVPEAQTRL